MSVSIYEVLRSHRNAGNTASIILANLLCDTASELPTITALTGYELEQGCKAHVIEDNQDYMMQSDGTWKPYGGEIWQNVYTKSEADTLLEGKQDALSQAQLAAANSGITSEKLTADEAALAEVVDAGAKNFAQTDSGSATQYAQIRCAVPAGTYKVSFSSLSSDDTDATQCQIYFLDEARQAIVSSRGLINRGTGVVSNDVNVSSDAGWIWIYASDTLSRSSGDTVSFSGAMCCTKAAWDASHTYRPYAPTNKELYNMIISLQNGGIVNLVYGMGVEIPNNSDLDDYKTPGTYYVLNNSNASTIANKPIGGSGFRLIVSYTSAFNRQRQEFYKPNTPDVIYIRNVGLDGNWSSWYQFTGTAVV